MPASHRPVVPTSLPFKGRPTISLWATGLVILCGLLAACGGGDEVPEAHANSEPARPHQAIEAWPENTTAFRLNSPALLLDQHHVRTLVDGDIVAAWNPRGSQALTPGMKVMFFGNGVGCDNPVRNAAVATVRSTGQDLQLPAAIEQTGMNLVEAASLTLWTPSAEGNPCAASSPSSQGPNLAYVDTTGNGAIGLYTQSGASPEGGQPLLTAFDARGADGEGSNSHIVSTFVGFRMPWWRDQAIRPWIGVWPDTKPARISSEQVLGSIEVGRNATVQAKQQIVVSLLNLSCQANRNQVAGPCQVQYLFNTAIARSDQNLPANNSARVWFDAMQGGIPIVAGHVPNYGDIAKDIETDFPLYESRGSATQKSPFSNATFDLRVSFSDFINAMKIVTAKRIGKNQMAVNENDISGVFGALWNDPREWVLVSTSVGQEIYNDRLADSRSWIGGRVISLYVGGAE